MPSEKFDARIEALNDIITIYENLRDNDSRVPLIDNMLKNCLGWDVNDIRKESHIQPGFLNYILSIDNKRIFVLETMLKGSHFFVPSSFNRRNYRINGTIWNNRVIRTAIQQGHEYAIHTGVKYAVVSNGFQYLIFEAFKLGGDWRDGEVMIFDSLNDIKENFELFYTILGKNSIKNGSLSTYISKNRPVYPFFRPLDGTDYSEQKVSQNELARYLYPFVDRVFGEIIDENQQLVLKQCYVFDKTNREAGSFLSPKFDSMPHYSSKYDISDFFETKTDAGDFQKSFEKSQEFLVKETPEGSLTLLLGGIGSGKTTFVHYFFKVILEKRTDILWFYVDFRNAPLEPDKIESYIHQCIVENFEKKYLIDLRKSLLPYGLDKLSPNLPSILRLFSFLRFNGYSIALVLDNVDQHSLTLPQFQERVFIVGQNLTKQFKCITLLTLREESFFKSTQSGVIDAYDLSSKIFHISSPRFESVMRSRLNYVLDLLEKSDKEIADELYKNIDFGDYKIKIKTFFKILKRSIDPHRQQGANILDFLDLITGGNMRQSLRFINKFMTSGNTDIQEIFTIEMKNNPEGREDSGYLIPYHHVVQSIMLEDSLFYLMSNSQVINLYHNNPEYTNSHFILLKTLSYLLTRINNQSDIGRGYIYITSILIDAQECGYTINEIEDGIKRLAYYGLIEFDNQYNRGYDSAKSVKITKTGEYYLNQLMDKFVYLDLIWGDTPISNKKINNSLKRRMIINDNDSLTRILKRFQRTEIFLRYLHEFEIKEFKDNYDILLNDFGNRKFVEKSAKNYFAEKKYILERMVQNRTLFGPGLPLMLAKKVKKMKFSF